MTALRVFSRYLVWHYTQALVDIVRLAKNLLWFFYHFFSIPLVAATLFSPWRRLGENYTHQLDPGAMFGTLIVNTLMRLVGFVIRSVFLIFGLLVLVLVFGFGILAFGLWFALPFIILALIYFSLFLILTI